MGPEDLREATQLDDPGFPGQPQDAPTGHSAVGTMTLFGPNVLTLGGRCKVSHPRLGDTNGSSNSAPDPGQGSSLTKIKGLGIQNH